MSAPLLELDALHVELLRGRMLAPVIHSVSLSVAAGEAVGLVGESGSGKTMTTRAILGLLPKGARQSGDVRFAGTSVPAMDAKARRRWRASEVGIVFQDPRAHINPVRTIGDFLVEGLAAAGRETGTAAERHVASLLRDVGIADAERRMRQRPGELSGGLLQRVMIAASLSCDPKLLLADEPTTALDVTTQEEVVAILDELRRDRGLALVFVTHDLDLAGAVCDRIAVMYAGTLVEARAAAGLAEATRHPYTAGLLASRPEIGDARHRLPVIPGRPVSAFEVAGGCPFAARCPLAVERCRIETPPLRDVEGGVAACHRAEEVPALVPVGGGAA